MKYRYVKTCTRLALVIGLGALAGGVQSQTTDTKEKPAMYSYEALWAVPRAKWAEYEKPDPASQKVIDHAFGDGTLIAYGSDTNLVHSAEGYTHDNWWASLSMAGVLKVLDDLEKVPGSTTGVINSVTKHADAVVVSHHYNWKSGTYKGAYTRGAMYKLKPIAPDDAVDVLSKSILEPLFEKLLADGSIVEYEIDVEAIHTEDPSDFWVFFVTPTADGLDKANAALRASLRANALISPALDSMVDFTPHRDSLDLTNVTYK